VPGPASIHLLPSSRRERVLSGLPVVERRLLCAVCCSCRTLSHAARELGLTDEEAARLWRRLATLAAARWPDA
jgi:hypothetical protein